MTDAQLQFVRQTLALPTVPAASARALLAEVDRLRSGLLDLAYRAENGLSTADLYAHIADLLKVKVKWLRSEVEQRP